MTAITDPVGELSKIIVALKRTIDWYIAHPVLHSDPLVPQAEIALIALKAMRGRWLERPDVTLQDASEEIERVCLELYRTSPLAGSIFDEYTVDFASAMLRLLRL